MPTTVYLIRHGEVHNPDHILYGRLPGFGLSANGRAQAAAARDYLRDKDIAALFASPQQRAQETAAVLLEAFPSLPPQTDDRLNEVYTSFEGKPLAELEKIGFDLYTNIPSPYEQPADILKRTRDFIQTVRQDYAGKSVAAVTHGDVVVFMLLFAKRAELRVQAKGDLQTVYGLPDPYPQTCSINRFTYSTDDPDEIPAYEYHRPYDL